MWLAGIDQVETQFMKTVIGRLVYSYELWSNFQSEIGWMRNGSVDKRLAVAVLPLFWDGLEVVQAHHLHLWNYPLLHSGLRSDT